MQWTEAHLKYKNVQINFASQVEKRTPIGKKKKPNKAPDFMLLKGKGKSETFILLFLYSEESKQPWFLRVFIFLMKNSN